MFTKNMESSNKPKIAIFTLVRDRLEYTKKTFEEMRKTAGIDFHHFIIDNGSKDGTTEWLKEWAPEDKHVKKVIYSEDNKGLWVAINILMQETNNFEGYDYVCKIDNDVEFFPDKSKDWLLKLYKTAMASMGEHWILSPYIGGLGGHSGGAPRNGVTLIHQQQVSLSRHVGGICLFTDREAYNEFMPETHSKARGWDVFFCSKLRSRGYSCGYIEDIIIKHRDTTSGQNKKFPKYLQRKQNEFREPYIGDRRGYHL